MRLAPGTKINPSLINLMTIRDKLVSAVTQWDVKQSRKRFWNPHALGIMLERVEDVMRDIESGTDPRRAVMAGFNDRLLDVCLRAIGEKTASVEEHHNLPMTYTPVAK